MHAASATRPVVRTGLPCRKRGPDQLSFSAKQSVRKYLDRQAMLPGIVTEADAEKLYKGNALVVANPYLMYARLSHLFDPKPKPAAVSIATAVIGR